MNKKQYIRFYLCWCLRGFLLADIQWKAEYIKGYDLYKYHKTLTFTFNLFKFFIPYFRKSMEEMSNYTRIEIEFLGLAILYRYSNEEIK